jgi:hypothetical protein
MKPQIRDIIKKAIIDKKELNPAEKDLLLEYFSMSDDDADNSQVAQATTIGSDYVLEDLTSQITGSNTDFELSRVAKRKCDVSCNLQLAPSSIIMFDNMKGFYLTFTPTVRDTIIAGYFV